MKSAARSLIKAQHAPSPGEDIWLQHCSLESAVEIELMKDHSNSGGKVFHKSITANKVRNVFNGEENKFFLVQPIIPEVLTGGGKSG